MKSTTKKSFTMNGPLRSVGIRGGASGVKIAVNGRDVVSVRNAHPSPSGAATANAGATSAADDGLSNIKLGQFIAEQQAEQQPVTSTDDEKEKERGIVVGPITPIPAPKPILTPRPARLGL